MIICYSAIYSTIAFVSLSEMEHQGLMQLSPEVFRLLR